jgi:hypothetical protein
MATGSATVTAKTGAAFQDTAIALPNVTRFDLDLARSTLTVYFGNNQIACYDIVGVTTLTDTISGLANTFVVS